MTQPNQDQAEYWNSETGKKWIEHEAALDLVFHLVSDALIARTDPQAGDRVLEIGCGTGATGRAFARAVGSGGSVISLDISAPLIAQAEARRDAEGLGHQSLICADAQTIDLAAGSFDLAVSRFGVMFFEDPVAAFENIRRTLKPGAPFVFASWASADRNPWFTIPRDIASTRLGSLPPTPPREPGPFAFEDRSYVVGLLVSAGFSTPRGEEVEIALHHPGGVEPAAYLAANLGSAARIIRFHEGTAADQAAIEAAVLAAFQPFATADGARVPARINLFAATA